MGAHPMNELERKRPCTVCLARDRRVEATHVAGTVDGFEWFECGQHEPTDNLASSARTSLTPIAQWFARHGLPLPGARPWHPCCGACGERFPNGPGEYTAACPKCGAPWNGSEAAKP